jgi:hypothetical protein
MVNAMGGKCICCGYNKCNEALEFHHLNPEQKKFGFGKIRANPTTWNIIVEELKKCILVCANCHREIEAGLIQAVFDSTFDVKYEQIKTEPYRTPALDRKCKTCKNSLKTFNKQKRYCSEECRPTSYKYDKNKNWRYKDKLNRRKVQRPTKEELQLLIEKHNWSELGRQFGVSDNAVRKWAKRYKLVKSA